MAAMANRIIASPFAMIGSIGVILQVPNAYDLLKKHGVHFEQVTAGKYKRKLSSLVPNTPDGRKKAKADVEMIHQLFQSSVSEYRPQMDLTSVATGEVWPAKEALDRQLLDEIKTIDDVLTQACREADVYVVKTADKTSRLEKWCSRNLQQTLLRGFHNVMHEKMWFF